MHFQLEMVHLGQTLQDGDHEGGSCFPDTVVHQPLVFRRSGLTFMLLV
jgi:hypothetical protein